MPRVNLPELMDQPWCPTPIREEITSSLRHMESLFDPFRVIVPRVGELLALSETRRVVDLCSGAGGPAIDVARHLRDRGDPAELVLTDLYPNRAAAEADRAGHRWWPTPVDAARVPEGLVGVRTVFNALHHLDPEVVVGVLRDAALNRAPFLSVEVVHRSPRGVIHTTAIGVGAWPLSWLRPWTARTLMLCAVFPVVPLVLVWEGFASCMRSYGEDELVRLAREASVPGYQFTVGRTPTWVPAMSLRWVEGRPVGPP